jgi:histidinol-phosphate/aromatic aminotransferase/cobyric acid decarboxylase-like protein/adenosyl cobinamide kinase/adenosyl cobinamide phosphate guanylyltransferase
MPLTVVLGGTRSGKSARAEALALASGLPVRYVATADPGGSMDDRIAAHLARRPPAWETVRAGASLADAVLPGGCTLIDGLGVWLAMSRPPRVIDELIAAVATDTVIVVAEEAGQGLVPLDAVARAWVDTLGEAVQRLSAAAERVEYVVAGRPIILHAAPAAHGPALRHHGDRDVRPGDIDHAVNVLAGGPPAWLRGALADALRDDAGRYPDDRAATAAIAALHGRDPADIVLTNGAVEALWLLGPALRPRLAAVVHPGFTETEAGLRAHGIPVTRVQRDPEADFALDPAAVPETADLVVVGNPASPSGTLAPAAAVLTLRRPGRTVVVDEAFIGMVPGEPGSLVGDPLPDVIVIRSLTKLVSVPGLRVGYAVAPARLAAALRAVRPPWSANALALAALQAAAAHPAELAVAAARAEAERGDLAARLAALPGVRVWPSATNFLLIEVADGPAVTAALRARQIAVRPAASFPGLDARHVRLTARDPAANARLVAALAQTLKPSSVGV